MSNIQAFKYSWQAKSLVPRNPLVVRADKLQRREIIEFQLQWFDGLITHGELSPLIGLSSETLEQAKHEILSALEIWQRLPQDFFKQLISIEALEKNKSLLWPTICSPSVILALEWMLVQRFDIKALTLPWPPCHQLLGSWHDTISASNSTLKIKIGRQSPEVEIDHIMTILHQYPNISLRLDANQSLDAKTWIRYLESIEAARIDYWEEPLAAKYHIVLDGIKNSPPVAFDESLIAKTSKNMPLSFGYKPKNIILRPTMCAGITSAMNYIRWAQANHIGVTITSSYEGKIGLQCLNWLAWQVNRHQPNLAATDTLNLYFA